MPNWNDVLTKIIGTLTLAGIFAVYHLWDRVKDLEAEFKRTALARDLADKHDTEARVERNMYTRDMDKAMDNFTTLMTKLDTLLETCLKRLDILEKHVFKIT